MGLGSREPGTPRSEGGGLGPGLLGPPSPCPSQVRHCPQCSVSSPVQPPFGTEVLGCRFGGHWKRRRRMEKGVSRPSQKAPQKSCGTPLLPGNCPGPCRPDGHTGEVHLPPTCWGLSAPLPILPARLGLLFPVSVSASLIPRSLPWFWTHFSLPGLHSLPPSFSLSLWV